MSDVSGALGASKPQARSRISNGSKFLQGVDGRTTWARRARDVHAQLVADRGGPDAVSEAETLIARRAAVLEAELERMEEVFASAGQAEPEDLVVREDFRFQPAAAWRGLKSASRKRNNKSLSHRMMRRKLYPAAARTALMASPWRYQR